MTAIRLFRLPALLLATLVLAGCGERTLDAASDAAWQRSVEAIRDDLGDSRRQRFDEALASLRPPPAPGVDAAPAGAVANPALDGLTASEVIARADQQRRDGEALGREQALREIADLHALQAQVQADSGQADRFRVLVAKFYKQRLGDTDTIQPFIELSLKNESDIAVARVTAVGILASPGREAPWLEQEFTFPVFGGMAPGKQHDTMLRPGPYSEWGTVEAPADATFTLRVTALETADGRRFLTSGAFTADDARRLRELEAVYR